jgi:hypothetical protein
MRRPPKALAHPESIGRRFEVRAPPMREPKSWLHCASRQPEKTNVSQRGTRGETRLVWGLGSWQYSKGRSAIVPLWQQSATKMQVESLSIGMMNLGLGMG